MPFDMSTAKPGDKVWWSDPDDGLSSGEYTIIEVYANSPEEREGDTMVFIRNERGSEAEVFMGELCAPEDRHAPPGRICDPGMRRWLYQPSLAAATRITPGMMASIPTSSMTTRLCP